MCDCIKKANKTLAEKNTAIDTLTTLTPDGKFKERMYIPTRRTDTHNKRKKPMTVFASFCPLCGEALT